jgi:hypothetical protein
VGNIGTKPKDGVAEEEHQRMVKPEAAGRVKPEAHARKRMRRPCTPAAEIIPYNERFLF